jgi:hypothetical protein
MRLPLVQHKGRRQLTLATPTLIEYFRSLCNKSLIQIGLFYPVKNGAKIKGLARRPGGFWNGSNERLSDRLSRKRSRLAIAGIISPIITYFSSIFSIEGHAAAVLAQFSAAQRGRKEMAPQTLEIAQNATGNGRRPNASQRGCPDAARHPHFASSPYSVCSVRTASSV